MKGWVLGMSRCYHLAVDLIICEKAPRANVPALAVFNVVNTTGTGLLLTQIIRY